MNRVCSIFQQLVQIFSRTEFDLAVRHHKADRHAPGFINWAQFTDTLFLEFPTTLDLWLVVVESGGAAAAATIRLLRFV
jgi:hypothetical protein